MTALLRVERQEIDHGEGRPLEWKATGVEVYGCIDQLRGSELMMAQQKEARADVKIETHWQPEIRVADRVVEIATGRIFNIVATNNIKNRNRELELTCIENVDA